LLVEDFYNNIVSLPISIEGFIYRPWTLITYMFVHFDLMHIFWNMVTLFWFGQILSNFTDSRKIIPLYLMGGIAGGLITMLFNLLPFFHGFIGTHLLGASAGVTAIIIAAATLVPHYRINMLFIGEVKLIYVALFVLFIDVLSVASYNNVGGNLAHLGGALMGYVFIQQFKCGTDLSKGINSFFERIQSMFRSAPRSKMKVAYKRSVSDEEYNYQRNVNQQQIDAILDKISKAGYESLSKQEKEILFKASKK
jgi:membrane associated rhomboid family serine protease